MAQCNRRHAPRIESWLFALFCLVTLVYWAAQFEPFLVPNNDYPSFEATARSFARTDLPDSYQRMPIFPALMALMAAVLPGPGAYLHAALVLNLAFSLGMAAAVFRLSSRLLGPGALLVAVLTLTSSQFQTAALQPLVEPSLGFFVALAFVGLEARKDWQYAAAFAAALSRYEAALLIPVLVLINIWRERRVVRHLLNGALASSGILIWAGLGALHGSGTSSYVAMMEGTSFRPDPSFLQRALKEPFRSWYAERGTGLIICAATLVIPLAAGVRRAIRDFPVEAAAMGFFWILSVAAIVAFGIAKARYVYPTQWIPILFFTGGALDLADRIRREWLSRVPWWVNGGLMIAAFCVGVVFTSRWVSRLASEDFQLLSLQWNLLYLTMGSGILVVGVVSHFAPLRIPSAAACLGVLALLLPLPAGAMSARCRDASKIYYANYGTWLAARWAREQLAPDEGLVALGSEHILALTELDPTRVSSFAALAATDTAELIEAMRRRGLTHVVYTSRHPTTRSDRWFDARLRADLARAFASGAPVPGYVHVATLDVPEAGHENPVQIYRLAPVNDAAPSDPR